MKLPKRWQICSFLFLATTLNYLDRQTLSVLAPTLQKELHLNNEALGWIIGVFYYTYTFSHLVVGPILDRVNLRWAFAIAVVLWSAVSGFTGLVNGFIALLLCRLALGVVEAVNWPGALRILSRAMEPKERALGNGLFTSGTSVASLIAPGLIIGLAAWAGWRWTFALIGSLGLLWVGGWLLLTRDRKLAPVWRDPAAPKPVGLMGQLRLYRSVIRSPRFLPILVVVALVNPCLYFSVNWLPVYFVQQRGLTLGGKMGWILTGIYLGLDLGNLACGSLILMLTRWGWSARSARRVVFIVGTFCMALCAAVPFLPLTGAVVALIFFNLGQGMWETMSLTMEQEVSVTHVSTAIGLLSGSGSLIGALSMVAVGKITQATGSFTIPMTTIGVVAILAGTAAWIASRNTSSEKGLPA
jgi:MFS transporter, ACS family, hexuronate transporter